MRKQVVVWIGALTLLLVTAGPGLARASSVRAGVKAGSVIFKKKVRAQDDDNKPKRCRPPHGTSVKSAPKATEKEEREGRERENGDDDDDKPKCRKYPPSRGDDGEDRDRNEKGEGNRVRSSRAGFEQNAKEPGGVITVGVLLIVGLGAFTVLIASRAVRRRLRDR